MSNINLPRDMKNKTDSKVIFKRADAFNNILLTCLKVLSRNSDESY